MRIILNNREEELTGSSLTVRELLELKNFTFRMIVVRINDKLVRKEEYANAKITEGDTVNIIHLISGG